MARVRARVRARARARVGARARARARARHTASLARPCRLTREQAQLHAYYIKGL